MSSVLYESHLTSLPLLARGKVRDIYAVGEDKLLLVTTDRLSAFDVVLKDPIPGKGQVLTALTQFWLRKLAHIVPNHSTDIAAEKVVSPAERDQVRGRAVVVKRLRPILVEAVARGYLIGSSWKDYQSQAMVSGIALPAGLQQASRLEKPIFTPAAKAATGLHDENVDFDYVVAVCGLSIAEQLRTLTLTLYQHAVEFALTKGLIIADTKFEFGLDKHGELMLMDEVFTPDSSRFWAAEAYQVGTNPHSFDKQFVRDWLEKMRWNKMPPAPALPSEIIQKTAAKYREALEKLTT